MADDLCARDVYPDRAESLVRQIVAPGGLRRGLARVGGDANDPPSSRPAR